MLKHIAKLPPLVGGRDIYYVDNAGDQVIEEFVGRSYSYTNGWGQEYIATVQDIEIVNASLSYTLGNNLENLNLSGTDNILKDGDDINDPHIRLWKFNCDAANDAEGRVVA